MAIIKNYVGETVQFEHEGVDLVGEVLSSNGSWIRVLVQVAPGLEEEFEVHVSAVKAD